MLSTLNAILFAFWGKYWLPRMYSWLNMILYMPCRFLCYYNSLLQRNRAPECLDPVKNTETEQHLSSSNTAVHFWTSLLNFTERLRVMRKALRTATEHQTHGTWGIRWCFSLKCGNHPSRTGVMMMGDSTEERAQMGRMVGRRFLKSPKCKRTVLSCPKPLRAWEGSVDKSCSRGRLWDLWGLSPKLCTAAGRLVRRL